MFGLAAPVAVARLVDEVGGVSAVLGERTALIAAIAPIEVSSSGSLCFCSALDPAKALAMVAAAAPGAVVVVGPVADWTELAAERCMVVVDDPRRWFIRAVRSIVPFRDSDHSGISPLAAIAPTARLGEGVVVSPFVFVDDGVQVGDGCYLGPGVRLMAGARLGRNVSIQANTVVGMTGLACERDDAGRFEMLPHLGSVVIGDHVRIGPCSTVARGTLRDTEIGEGCIIGSQVNVGHNCTLGAHCFLSAGVILSGSSALEEFCWLAPAVTVGNKVRMNRWSMAGVGSVVTRDVAENALVLGNPARPVPRQNTFNVQGG